MKNLLTVIKFTIKDMVRKKSFILSTIIILGLIVAGFSIPKILKNIDEEKGKEKIVISDAKNIYEGQLELLKNMNLDKYDIVVEEATSDELKEKIKNSEIKSAIMIEKEESLKFVYLVESTRWSPQMPEDMLKALSSLYSNIQINKLGLTEDELKTITPKFEVELEQAKDDKVEEGNIFVMMAMSFTLSIAIIFFTTQVSTSITTEKTSKIIETLVTSTSPRTIVLGKTIGIGIVGLVQVILILTTAFVSANLFLEPEMLSMVLDLSKITPSFVIITLVYFILGYFTYALLYALTGSLVSKPEDIQSANTPVSMIAMVGFYLGYFSIVIDPTSSINTFASMFPISSPFCMPSRIMMGLSSGWDIAISIIVLIATVLVIAKIAIKVYSNAILNYGSKMSLKDAFKMYKNK